MRKKLITDSVLAQIPHWINDEGLGLWQIARKVGCTVGTLRVRCSHYHISLRRSASVPQATKLSLVLSTKILMHLREQAASIGMSESTLIAELLETIDKDDLYRAILDDKLEPPPTGTAAVE
jgi:hypothetical protein